MQINTRKRLIFYLPLLLTVIKTGAQTTDTVSTFSIITYLDAYYAHYTDTAAPGSFQKFPTVSPRDNTPSLNTAQISFQYTGEQVRGVATFHFGDLPTAVWSPAPYNNVMEAHIGFKVYSKLWIDAGFFRGHLGTEFVLPVENITSSLAVGTFYEPVCESGIRLNFDPNKKLEINLFLLNGYNVYFDSSKKKSFGAGVTYALGDHGNIGYTNYIGDMSRPADPLSHMRIMQNVFINYEYKKLKMQAGGDFVMQQNSDLATGNKYAYMFSALATAKYQFAKKVGVYGRLEVFSDPDAVLSTLITDQTGAQTGYKLWGATAGFEIKPTKGSYIKIENRLLTMDKNQVIFYYNGTPYSSRYEIMINGGVTFDLLKSVMTRKAE